jgi:hypothetical protein
MGSQVFIRDGQYYKLTDTGEKPLTPAEMAKLQVSYGSARTPGLDKIAENIKNLPLKTTAGTEGAGGRDMPAGTDAFSTNQLLNEMGVSIPERLYLKNLILDPEKAKEYLVSHGYDVKPYGGGFNFAVRRSASDPWRLVDPEPGKDVNGKALGDAKFSDISGEWGRAKEFFMDMLDLTSEAAMTGAAMLATGGGSLAAQTIRMAGALGAGEAVREGAGAMGDVGLENISPLQIAATAGVGAATGVGGAAGLWTLNKATGGLMKLMARVGGIEGKAGTNLTGPEVLSERADIKGFGKIKTYDEAEYEVRSIINDVGDRHKNPFPESVSSDDLMQQAEQGGLKIDGTDLIKFLDKYAGVPVKQGKKIIRLRGTDPASQSAINRDRGLPTEMRQALDMVYDTMQINGVKDISLAPPTFWVALKRDFQAKAAQEGGFGGSQSLIGAETRAKLDEAAGLMNGIARREMKATGLMSADGRTYDELMDVVGEKTRHLKFFKKAFNHGASEAERKNTAISMIASIGNKSKGGTREFALNFDKLFKTNITDIMKQPVIGEAFGDLGEASIMPRVSATGSLIGMGAAGSAGAYFGSQRGKTLEGALLGAAAASPLGILTTAKFGKGIMKYGSKIAPDASLVARPTALAAGQELVKRYTP